MFKLSKFAWVFLIVTFGVVSISYGKDFRGSVNNLKSELETIARVLAAVAFVVGGIAFFFSKHLGFERLSAAIIGTVVIVSAPAFLMFADRVFA